MDGHDLDEAEEDCGGLIVAGGDASRLRRGAHQSLDAVRRELFYALPRRVRRTLEIAVTPDGDIETTALMDAEVSMIESLIVKRGLRSIGGARTCAASRKPPPTTQPAKGDAPLLRTRLSAERGALTCGRSLPHLRTHRGLPPCAE
jgi:hypothetical protein